MKHLVVIGGGASGFFCAVNAARMCRRLKVTILEKTAKTLAKVKISGGGRCNVTHQEMPVATFAAQYPRGARLLKKSLFQFGAVQTCNWFENRGVALKTEPDGRVFPKSNQSESIIEALMAEARKYNVEIRLHQNVVSLAAAKLDNTQPFTWQIHIEGQLVPLRADFVCVATGGHMKASAYDFLSALDHDILPPVPSLFTFNLGRHPITALMGVSVPQASIRIVGSKLRQSGPLLITHWGFSGPAVLKLSAWGAQWLSECGYQFSILINWLGDQWPEKELRDQWQQIREKHAAQPIGDKNPFGLPKRLWAFLLSASGIDEDLYWSKLPAGPQNKLLQHLVADTYTISGKTTFKEEFVTCGGIDLASIDPQTMQSRLHQGLYFTGEVMNVDGITGGFNFQHAWSSGYIAAANIAQMATTEGAC